MKRYHVATTGYQGYVTMSEMDLKAYVKEETIKARRYFGTAVCHKFIGDSGTIYFKVTARKDENSSLWTNITAHKH